MKLLNDCFRQELNSKAESKFNKLKAQAKTKIANLNKELEKLKAEKGGGDTSFNISTLVRNKHLECSSLFLFGLQYVYVHVLVMIVVEIFLLGVGGGGGGGGA